MIEKFKDWMSESISNEEIYERFLSKVGIEILMEAFMKASGEKMTYYIIGKPELTSKVMIRANMIRINVFEVLRAGGSVVVMDFFSKEEAQKFIDSSANWKNVDLYLPQYDTDTYFNINEKHEKSISVSQLCAILEKLNVNLEKLASDNRGKLHGEEYGL